MNFEEFSKQAKDKLDAYPSGIDAEGLWEAIEPALQEDKKKRRFFIFPLFAAILGIGIFFIWSPIDLKRESKISASILAPAEGEQMVLTPTTSHISQRVDTEVQPLPIEQTLSNNSYLVNFTLTEKEKKAEDITNKKTETTKTFEIAPIEKIILRNSRITPEIPLKEIADLPTPESSLLIQFRGLDRQKKSGLRKGIGISGGCGLNAQNLSTTSAFGDYLVLRQDVESTLEDIYLGIDLLLAPTPNWNFRTGLQVTRVGSKFSQEYTNMEFLPIENSLQATYITEVNQDTTLVYGTVFDRSMTSRKKLTHNYTYLLDVPLIAGYSRHSYPWVIGIEAGALWNVKLQRKGEIFDVDEGYYDLEKDEKNWYKDQVGLSVYLGGTIAYHLAGSWQVSLSPAYRFPVDLSTATNPLSQKYSGLGLRAGLRYWW